MKNKILFHVEENSFIERCLTKLFSIKIILGIIFWTFIMLGKQLFLSKLFYIFISVYLLFIIKVIYESRILITEITLKNDNVLFKYNKFNKKLELIIPQNEFTYKIRNTTNVTLISDRIFFYRKEKCMLIQYSILKKWTIKEINDVSKSLKNNELRRVFGENL
jgi:hypothetical protein